MKGTVHYSVDGELAALRIDNPPVNPLSSGVRQGIFDGMNAAKGDVHMAHFDQRSPGLDGRHRATLLR